MTMNVKQKMIKAMHENCLRDDIAYHYMLDAAISALIDHYKSLPNATGFILAGDFERVMEMEG